MKSYSRLFLISIFILLSSVIFPQTLFWAEKEVISEGISLFSSFKSSDNYLYSAWQEINYFPGNDGGVSNLVIRRSSDGYLWEEVKHSVAPVEFYGITPPKYYSIDSDREGNLILVSSSGSKSSFNRLTIFYLKSGSLNLEELTTLDYDRAVLSPSIYFRGIDGELGYILFVSQLKVLTTEVQEDNSEISLESGAISIFSRTSEDGENWSLNREFINRNSDQSGLPIYKYYNNEELVVYQSVVTSTNEDNNFQLFIKSKQLDEDSWGEDKLLTGSDEFITGSGNQAFSAFDNQRPSFVIRENQIGLTWERSYGYEASKIYFSYLTKDSDGYTLINSEKVTSGTRSCSRPRGFEFNEEFYLLWFDNQLGSNDIVMAIPDKQSGLWIEKIVSDDRNYFSIFGDFVQFKDSLRVYWEDQTINRESYNSTRSRIQALNPDRDVDAPIISSSYKKRDNKTNVRFRWSKPNDSSGIKGFYYSWENSEGEVLVQNRVLSNVEISSFLEATEDGEYIFSIYAEDNAGNLSDLSTYRYIYDKTPPDKVYFPEPKTDENGFLLSNSELIKWDTFDDDVVGFSNVITYLGTNYDSNNFNINRVKISNNFTNVQSVSFNNFDNGFYALTVRALDSAGNIGRPEAFIFRLNKYIPVTYISYISYSQNTNGELVTTIHGRGFKADGDVDVVILDRDGLEPWDYRFENDPNVFNVVTDRRIEGPNLDDIEGGTYRVGIIHPVRGTYFSGPVIRVESTGTVKFGDFTKGYEEVWQTISQKRVNVSFEFLIFTLIIVSALIMLLFSIFKLSVINRERSRLYHDAKALVNGTPFLDEKVILRIRDMKKKGFGLRVKFTALIISLIIGVIVLISLPLANFMIDTQKKNLTDGLVSRTEILLNSLVSGAKDYIERKSVLDLNNLISTTEAMPEVMWGTIVGVSSSDSNVTNALWAYTDQQTAGYFVPLPNRIEIKSFNDNFADIIREDELQLLLKLYSIEAGYYILNENNSLEDDLKLRKIITDLGYPREIVIGQTQYRDSLSEEVELLIKDIEDKGTKELLDKKEELIRLSAERINATGARGSELSEIINTLNTQISDALSLMSSNTGVVPIVNYETVQDQSSYVFYKPILYNETGVDTFYKGLVRLEVSTETINMEILNSINNLIIRVGITAIVAILIGIIGALFLATFMINPIKKLVAGVQMIRDTEDKSELKNHEIVVKSKDELFTLASTVNQMTEGLVKAAAMSKDVTMGKEIQKMFIPLELNPNGEGKLTTGQFDNKEISVFGYYEGAKGVSGDYFDYRQIDEDHFAMIKCDIAGKGVPASLIMVEVATIFLSYFRKWSVREQGYKIDELVYSMNDLLEERGFKGRFAAFIVVILNTKTGKCYMCNAGDNLVHIYRAKKHEMETMVLHEVPAAGIFSSDMLEMQGGYKVETTTLGKNDILFLFTDGVEESKHLFRDEKYNEIVCTHPGLKEGELHDTHAVNEEFEELGVPRINEILHSVIHKTNYSLKKYHYPQPEANFDFNFSTLKGEVKDAVLGLIAVEKVFRLNPDPSANKEDTIKIDKVVNNFLMQHFEQYSSYYKFKVDKGENAQHDFFSHIKEDDQYDDLTILAIKKK
ncbi:HAMP domain-containing protein [Thiospirochaeta perfilievii]|uniref:HAMP domain-containing protein n=1 Tax=Thiospirochaeta perfilievii TaxID=252967 RepID=A0A5C1Q7F9_9SPIO|nr:SpoIIE family protein phosphatase [Thiospirochaeta perfilievii]QEN03248.1 HAMP domain-containing protein [Thiospirochaeta perfilievii]